MGKESSSRSIAKAISYRLLGSASTALIIYVLSKGDTTMSLAGGGLDGIVKIGVYFLHERLWNHIDYGRPKSPEYEI